MFFREEYQKFREPTRDYKSRRVIFVLPSADSNFSFTSDNLHCGIRITISLKNQFYFDKCLPMDCSASCVRFEKCSTFLEWAIKFKSGKTSVEHFLDDFLLAGKSGTGDCWQLMDHFRIICEDLGVPLAEDKTIGPCALTFSRNESQILISAFIPEDTLI
jgi:hypothetical protein